jgi:hypothetical protein
MYCVHITPNELALATAGISALTAIVTLWNGRVAANTQLQISDDQQQNAVRDRLWQARSTAYVDVLWLIEWWEKTFYAGSTDLPSKALRDKDRENNWDQLLGARINAFGTQQVRGAFAKMIQAFEDTYHVHDVIHGHATGDSAKALSDPMNSQRQAIETARRLIEQLRDLIRAELQHGAEGS